MAKRSAMRRFGTGCVITMDDEIVSAGWSHMSHLQLCELESMHSEIHALGRGRHLNLNGAVAWTATVSFKSGNLTNARPCLTCSVALRSAGIKTVYYTERGTTELGYINLESDLVGLKVYKKRGSYV